MNFNSKITSLSLGLLFSLPLTINAQSVKAQSSCQTAINTVVRDIKSKRVQKVHTHIDEYSQSINKQRGVSTLTVGMSGNNYRLTNSILNSPFLMRSWFTQISNSCQNIGVVRFGVWQTSDIHNFAINNNNQIFVYKCDDSPRNFINPDSPPQWNTLSRDYCSYVPFDTVHKQ